MQASTHVETRPTVVVITAVAVAAIAIAVVGAVVVTADVVGIAEICAAGIGAEGRGPLMFYQVFAQVAFVSIGEAEPGCRCVWRPVSGRLPVRSSCQNRASRSEQWNIKLTYCDMSGSIGVFARVVVVGLAGVLQQAVAREVEQKIG